MAFITEILDSISGVYSEAITSLPSNYALLLKVFIFAILLSLYSIFTYKFYIYLSKKDLIELNLTRLNRIEHAFLKRFFAIILYFIEYIIVLPFLIFFWFAVLALLILLISENQGINHVIVISASMVAAIRILAYYSEDLSRELAKIFPLTVLTIFILNPTFFSLERVATNLSQVPQFLTSILFFFILIIVLELILRLVELTIRYFNPNEEESDEN